MPDSKPVVGSELIDGIVVLTVDYPPVNSLSAAVRLGLRDGIDAANANDDAKAIVIICAGKTFIAGADITEFGKPMALPLLSALITTIEQSPKPIVAAMHGTALGGGLELALACHARIADPASRCGLPEVKLGLIAGAGGTQRLPRLVGAELALEMTTSGTPIKGSQLLESGLVDEIAPTGGLRGAATSLAQQIAAADEKPKPVRDRTDKIAAAKADSSLFERFRAANARKFKGFDAPEASIRAIEAAVNLPFDEGLAEERRLFTELMAGSQSAAQRYFFFAERQAAKIADVPSDTVLRDLRSVGIIGAGTMGGGIAMNFLSVGIPVTIVEMREDALNNGIATIRRNYEGSAKRGRISAETVERNMGLLTGALSLDALSDCDLIIEAVFEDMDIKKDVFAKLDKIAKSGAILATNTSYLNINEIAAVTSRLGDVVGMHFFSPANVMRLLEVVRADRTAPDVLATVMNVAKRINKAAVVAGVCYGFIGNRILSVRRTESRRLLFEGYMPWEIDRVLLDFGMPMGPYAMADLAGLDIGWAPGKSSGDILRDRMSEAGRRGQKNRAGFYDYDENRRPTPSPATEEIVRQFIADTDRPQRTLHDETMLQRMIYPMINEGAKILEERIAARASDIDVAWVTGYGWPVYRGGPMFYADLIGLGHVVETLDRFARDVSPEFAVAPLLRNIADAGGRLSAFENS
jgi:3-hydroxyacyl-CoA dehydrogenase